MFSWAQSTLPAVKNCQTNVRLRTPHDQTPEGKEGKYTVLGWESAEEGKNQILVWARRCKMLNVTSKECLRWLIFAFAQHPRPRLDLQTQVLTTDSESDGEREGVCLVFWKSMLCFGCRTEGGCGAKWGGRGHEAVTNSFKTVLSGTMLFHTVF